MRKYIIKMKDGSEQHVMPAIHDTRKDALLTILHYATKSIEDENDDCIGDPFYYTIEEVDEKDVNERITDFESARQALGRKPKNPLRVAMAKETSSKSDLSFDGISRLVEEINPKDAAGFVFAYTARTPSSAGANFGSRLCFKSSERAAQFGKQFADLYNKVFL